MGIIMTMKTIRFKCHQCKKFTDWNYVRPMIKRSKYQSRTDIDATKMSIYRCCDCGLEWWSSK